MRSAEAYATPATADVVVRAERVVTGGIERAASVVVAEGRIVAVAGRDDPWPARREVRVPPDVVVLPGLVDTHVHLQEPGPVVLEGFASGSAAAAAGGITTLVDMPLDSVPVTTDAAALAAKRAAADDARPLVDVAFWGGAVPANLGRLAELHAGGVVGLKAYLTDSGHPDFPALDVAGLTSALAQTAQLGTVLAVHAEDAELLRRAPAHTGPRYRDYLAERPPEIEVRAVEAVVEAVRRTGARAHVVHVASGAAADVVARARAEGLPITAETCPHYLAPPPGGVPDGATRFACCPPVRGPEEADRLWEHLGAGTLALVVSDHSPLLPAGAPEPADFSAAPGGIVGLQLALPVTWTAACARGFGPADVARWMSTAPAALARLGAKGEIAPGRDADLCLFAPDESFTVDPARLRHRRPVTPYQGRELAGVVREVWLRGEPVDLVPPEKARGRGKGRLLVRDRSGGIPA